MNSYQKVGTAVAFSCSCRGNTGEKQERLMRYFDERDRSAAKDGITSFGRWLSSRKIESWGFFIAGFVLARIIF